MDVDTVKSYAQDLRGLLEESDFTERKAFLRSFVKRIEVGRNEVTVHYKIPLPPEGKTKERVSVLPIDTFCGAGGIRTPYLCDANAALSQLSYSPTYQR